MIECVSPLASTKSPYLANTRLYNSAFNVSTLLSNGLVDSRCKQVFNLLKFLRLLALAKLKGSLELDRVNLSNKNQRIVVSTSDVRLVS